MWVPEDIGIEDLHIGGDSDTMVSTGQFSCCIRTQQKKVPKVLPTIRYHHQLSILTQFVELSLP